MSALLDSPATTHAVTATALTRTYGDGDSAVHALRGVSLDLPAGQFTAVMGPSGSGKSTLMHLLAGLDTPSSGTVSVAGQDITRMKDRELTRLRRKHIGFVFQSFNLLPTLSAEENVVLPLAIAGKRPSAEDIDTLIARVGLTERRRHHPAELSGGQQQRVAIARALITRPTVLFADEPTGNLDSKAGAGILRLLRDAVELEGQTTLMVTHDPRAAAIADRVLYLADGRVVADIADPTEADVLAVMKAAAPMNRFALRGLVARPVRTILTTLAIVLGVAMVSGAFTLTDTMRGAADSLSSSAYDGTDAVVSARTAFGIKATDWTAKRPTIDAKTLERVRAVPGVAVAVGDITDEAKIVGRDGKPVGDGPYFGSGYDARTPGAQATTPFRLQSGHWATGAREVVLDAATAEKEHYGLGSHVRVTTPGAAHEYEVVGIARFGQVKSLGTATAAVFDLRTAQSLFHKDGAYDSILVAGREGVPAADVRKAVAAAVGASAQVQTAKAHDRFGLEGLEQFISIIRTVLLVFGFVAIFVGAFTIFNTLSITVAQRSREFGLLRMVGAARRQVLGSVLLEALGIGLLASAAGLAVGFGVANGLDAIFRSMDLALPDAGTVFASRTVIVSMLVGTLVTLVAGVIPAWRATRVPPVAALRDADPATHKVRLPARAVRGLASLIGRPAEKIGGSAGALARRNAMRHPGRTAVTASALMIGVALVTLVTVIAQGLRDSTTGTLEKRINATHVITGADGWSPTDPSVARAVAATRGVDGVTAIRQDVGLVFGDKEVVNSVDPATAPGRFAFDYAAGPEDAISTLGSDGAIVDEGLAGEHHLKVGDRLAVTSANGTKLALTVKAIEKSPVLDALAMGPVTIAQGTYERAFENNRNLLTLVSAGDAGALAQTLKAFPDAEAQTKAAYIDSLTSDIDSLLAIFYVLLALAVIVSLFGIVNTLVLSTFERTRELGTLRAVGMTRRQVRRMVRHESVITALIGAGLGIAAGLGLAAIVTSVFADEGLTFAVPAGSLVVLTVVAGIAGILAAIVPARRASRLDVLTALAYE